jgi:hypothetical protein
MLSLLLCLACSGNRFAATPLVAEPCDHWQIYLEQAQSSDRVVGCTQRALALVGTDAIDAAASRWGEVLSEAGWKLTEDDSLPAALPPSPATVNQVWSSAGRDLALAVSRNTVTHTSLVVIP